MSKSSGVLAGVILFSNLAYAGRPIETDDASVTWDETCQLDFWTETSRELRQDNFNSGCNFLGHGEFGLGIAEVQGNRKDQFLGAIGYKHIFQSFTDSTAGFGIAASREWGRFRVTNKSSQETLFTAITPVPLKSDDLLLHLNLGYLQYIDQSLSDSSIFKAAALDYSFNNRIGFSVETYSGVQDTLSWRVGTRYTLISDFLQIDASYGSDYGSFRKARAFTLGFGITPRF